MCFIQFFVPGKTRDLIGIQFSYFLIINDYKIIETNYQDNRFFKYPALYLACLTPGKLEKEKQDFYRKIVISIIFSS